VSKNWYIPVNIVSFYVQEWEDYGTTGFGDCNGQPLNTGIYLSSDEDGCDLLTEQLKPRLSRAGFSKEDTKRISQIVSSWLYSISDVADSTEALLDLFGLEQEER